MKRKYEISLFKSLELCTGTIDYLKNPKENVVLTHVINPTSDLCGIMIKQLNHLPLMSFENEVLDNLIEAGNHENRVMYLTDLRNKFSFELSEYVEPYSKGDYPKSLLYNYLIYSNKLQQYILSVLEKFEKQFNSNSIKQTDIKFEQPKYKEQFDNFQELFEAAKYFDTIEKPKNEAHDQSLYSLNEFTFNIWLQENKGWKYGNEKKYKELLTKQNWIEFLEYQKQKALEKEQAYEAEKKIWQPIQEKEIESESNKTGNYNNDEWLNIVKSHEISRELIGIKKDYKDNLNNFNSTSPVFYHIDSVLAEYNITLKQALKILLDTKGAYSPDWNKNIIESIINNIETRIKYDLNSTLLDDLKPQQKETKNKSEISEYEKILSEIKNAENKFWKGLPMEKVIAHFEIMTTRKNKNGYIFLTLEQLISFLRKGFINDTTQPQQKINCSNGEKGFVILRFYELFDLAVSQYGHPNKKVKFINLFTDCFNNWDKKTIEPFFKPNKTKDEW